MYGGICGVHCLQVSVHVCACARGHKSILRAIPYKRSAVFLRLALTLGVRAC